MWLGAGKEIKVVGAFGEASADVLTPIQRTALFNAERNGLWRCMGASSLEDGGPRSLGETGHQDPVGVEGVRGLARARLARICRTSAPITGSRGLIADARRPITKTHGKPITNGLGLVRTVLQIGRRQHSS